LSDIKFFQKRGRGWTPREQPRPASLAHMLRGNFGLQAKISSGFPPAYHFAL
jgi:hypothetical protein